MSARVIDNETVEVVLAGQLGELFGRTHHLVASTTAEVFRLLGMNYPEFKQKLIEDSQAGAEYQIVVDDGARGVGEKELTLPIAGKRLTIVHVIQGGGGKLFSAVEFVVGLIILAVCWWNPFGWVAGGGMMMAAVGLGVSLTLGGITGLLTTIPKNSNGGNSGDSLSSFYFNGPANTQQQGAPVPVVYGRVLIGSQAISAALSAVDLANAPAETGNLT
jgi:predicted phage tail protein